MLVNGKLGGVKRSKLTDSEPAGDQGEHVTDNLEVERLNGLSDGNIGVLSVERIDKSTEEDIHGSNKTLGD